MLFLGLYTIPPIFDRIFKKSLYLFLKPFKNLNSAIPKQLFYIPSYYSLVASNQFEDLRNNIIEIIPLKRAVETAFLPFKIIPKNQKQFQTLICIKFFSQQKAIKNYEEYPFIDYEKLLSNQNIKDIKMCGLFQLFIIKIMQTYSNSIFKRSNIEVKLGLKVLKPFRKTLEEQQRERNTSNLENFLFCFTFKIHTWFDRLIHSKYSRIDVNF
ncbi:unnamed protein product [Paramecium sonneborni]|uniref:Uncharacterized protein n=1 Tax=Paramecium sonneborni TaxID=65129 RepID=A0A8S1KU05_9CILI|nr:unnamed protein product [Paramecium sonneborni]